MFRYKGYIGWYDYDDKLQLFKGQVANVMTLITFQGKSIETTQQAFEEAVEDYLTWCRKHLKEPEQPSSLFSVPTSPSRNAS